MALGIPDQAPEYRRVEDDDGCMHEECDQCGSPVTDRKRHTEWHHRIWFTVNSLIAQKGR